MKSNRNYPLLLAGQFLGAFGDNAILAVIVGQLTYQAQAGAIERMFEQVSARPGATCLVGGGAAGQFFDMLRMPKRQIDNLVLEGLARIGREITP